MSGQQSGQESNHWQLQEQTCAFATLCRVKCAFYAPVRKAGHHCHSPRSCASVTREDNTMRTQRGSMFFEGLLFLILSQSAPADSTRSAHRFSEVAPWRGNQRIPVRLVCRDKTTGRAAGTPRRFARPVGRQSGSTDMRKLLRVFSSVLTVFKDP